VLSLDAANRLGVLSLELSRALSRGVADPQEDPANAPFSADADAILDERVLVRFVRRVAGGPDDSVRLRLAD
jgi:hypothetical protein